jgi:hypothetical protein
MQGKTTERLPNEALLPGLKEIQHDIERCIQKAQAKQPHMRERFGTFELTVGIAQLQEAKLWIDQAIYRLGYKSQ